MNIFNIVLSAVIVVACFTAYIISIHRERKRLANTDKFAVKLLSVIGNILLALSLLLLVFVCILFLVMEVECDYQKALYLQILLYSIALFGGVFICVSKILDKK